MYFVLILILHFSGVDILIPSSLLIFGVHVEVSFFGHTDNVHHSCRLSGECERCEEASVTLDEYLLSLSSD